MKNQTKTIFTLLLFVMLMSNVMALNLKPAIINENYTVLQTCASCTYINLTISNVDGIVTSNQAMTNNGSGMWIYYITPTTMSRHDVTGIGDCDGIDSTFATYFDVTPSGKIATTGEAILYALFSTILFLIISTLAFFIFTIPSTNEKDDGGFETKIFRIKYLRFIFIFLLWPLTILLLNFLNGLAVSFSALSMFSGTLGFLFEIMMRLSWPFTVIMIVWLVVMLVHDTNVQKELDKFNKFDPFKGAP